MQSSAASPETLSDTRLLKVGLDTVWTLLCAALVFFMNAGFACVEAGLCRQKNCVNMLAKNFVVFACSSVAFYFIGWGLMFGNGTYFGTEGVFMLSGADNSPAVGEAYQGAYSSMAWAGIPLMAKFFFQLVFAGTAATIVSGVLAERCQFSSFVAFSLLLVALVYPVVGHWIWGGGWLAQRGFHDFAGSTVVHSVGGWAALAGVLTVGPRIGKYVDGQVKPIPGHNLALATIGVFILWLGWFGFNPGSTLSVGDGSAIAHLFVTTNCAAAAGVFFSMVTAWVLMKKPDLSMMLNGCLGGLVSITASCAFVTVPSALLIGSIAGILVVLSVLWFDRMRIDDPVGALSVHLINGVWGTLALGLFADLEISTRVAGIPLQGGWKPLLTQLEGVVAAGLFSFSVSLALWWLVKHLIGVRVSREEELEGLDLGEHGNEAYPDFQTGARR